MSTYDLRAPARETLAKLAAAKDWDAWQGALTLFAGVGASTAAEKAGATAADFSCGTVGAAYHDLCGLETNCKRTAEWLAKWLGRNIPDRCRDGDNNSLTPYVQEKHYVGGGLSYVAVYTEYKIGD